MPHYADEGDFRRALIARLRQLDTDTGWGPQDAARAFALQQLTSRLFRSESARSWVLTGGTALQYRSNEARPTTDADLAFAADAAAIRGTLTSALAPREGEYGIFDVAVRVSADSGQHKARITYLVDGQRLASVTLDVNTSRATDFEPDTLTPAPFVSMPDLLPAPPMQVYPVARHLADKVTAMYERHGAASPSPSTRPHDLAGHRRDNRSWTQISGGNRSTVTVVLASEAGTNALLSGRVEQQPPKQFHEQLALRGIKRRE